MKNRRLKIFMGHSWVGWFNILILQWFFIRLGYIADFDSGKIEKYIIRRWIVPLTGWRGEFKYLLKKEF